VENWKPYFYPNFRVEVFNRKGQKLFESTSYNGDWNVSLNGKPLP
jgi:hypothetical protein